MSHDGIQLIRCCVVLWSMRKHLQHWPEKLFYIIGSLSNVTEVLSKYRCLFLSDSFTRIIVISFFPTRVLESHLVLTWKHLAIKNRRCRRVLRCVLLRRKYEGETRRRGRAGLWRARAMARLLGIESWGRRQRHAPQGDINLNPLG